MNQESGLFSISEVSRKLNIPKYTLRFWEKEFGGLFIPLRTKGGQRRFTLQHLRVIEGIKKRKEKGMNLYEIKREFFNTPQEGTRQEGQIDRLANRVAEVVKTEVFNFFEMERLYE
jgi:DNA-binding transcriptional MerR regulator